MASNGVAAVIANSSPPGAAKFDPWQGIYADAQLVTGDASGSGGFTGLGAKRDTFLNQFGEITRRGRPFGGRSDTGAQKSCGSRQGKSR